MCTMPTLTKYLIKLLKKKRFNKTVIKIIKLLRFCENNYNKLLSFITSHHLKSFCKYFVMAIGALVYLQASSMLCLALNDKKNIDKALPTTFIHYLMQAIHQVGFHFSIYYFIAAVALLFPAAFIGTAFLSYRYHHYHGLKIFTLITCIILAWFSFSDTIIQYYLTNKYMIGNPIRYISYWLLFSNQNNITSHLIYAALLSGVPLALIILILHNKKKTPDIYGKAHFATLKEIQKKGYLGKEGIFLGSAFGHDIILPGFEHVILFAPTGSGKTTSNAIINLFLWLQSCISLDLKLTLYKSTSGYRLSMGHKVYVWAPGSRFSHAFNALDFISTEPIERIDQVQRIAQILIPDNPKVSDPFWYQNARFILIALIHYVLDVKEHRKTLGEINILVKSSSNFTEFARIASEREDIHYISRNNFLRFLNTNHKTHKNIIDTLLTYLAIFDNPLIEAATARSDFDIRNLRKEKMTIYIGVNPADLERLSPLISIFYEQVVDVMLRETPNANEPFDVLLQIDEFASLRRMESFLKIGIFREYRIRALLYIQDLSQIYSKYGRDDAKIFLNAKARIAYTQIDLESSQYLESCLGSKTMEVKNHHATGKSVNYVARPLMLAQEIRTLCSKKMLILIEGCNAILGKKIFWFSYRKYRQKILKPVKIPSILPLANELFERAKLMSDTDRIATAKLLDQPNTQNNDSEVEIEMPGEKLHVNLTGNDIELDHSI